MNRPLPPPNTVYLLRRSANETCLWLETLGDPSVVRQAHKIDKPEIIEDVVTSPPNRKHEACLVTSKKLAELAFGQSITPNRLLEDIHTQCLNDIVTVGIVHGYVKPADRQTIIDQRTRVTQQLLSSVSLFHG